MNFSTSFVHYFLISHQFTCLRQLKTLIRSVSGWELRKLDVNSLNLLSKSIQDLRNSNICIVALLSFKNVCVRLFAEELDKLIAKIQSKFSAHLVVRSSICCVCEGAAKVRYTLCHGHWIVKKKKLKSILWWLQSRLIMRTGRLSELQDNPCNIRKATS